MSFSGNEEDPLFLNDGRGRFADVGFEAGVDLRGDGRSSVFADLDGDGDLDLVVRQISSPKLIVFRNDGIPGTDTHWLALQVGAEGGAPHGLGRTVEVCVGKRCQRRELTAGHGYLSQGPAELHFGLGTARAATSVRLLGKGGGLGLSGTGPLAGDAAYRLVEGAKGLKVEPVARKAVPFGPPATPDLTREALGVGKAGRPLLVNVWAPWCQPCKEEAPALAALPASDAFDRLALSVEVDEAANAAGAKTLGIPWPLATASEAQVRLLGARIDALPLPATLAFDAQGRLVGAAVGKVSARSLQRLAERASGKR